MASITSFANEKSLVLGNRQALVRQFDFGSWTEIRIGMLFGFVGNASDTSSYVVEEISITTTSDRIFFGIKSSGSNLPLTSGVNFVGSVANHGGNSSLGWAYAQGYAGSRYEYFGHSFPLSPVYVSGSATAFYPNIGSYPGNVGFKTPSGSMTVPNYNGFYGLKFVLNNSGSANQSISMTYKQIENSYASGAFQLQSTLLDETSWSSWSGAPSSSWVGVPTPDCFFAYLPFYNNRLRISAMQAIKIR